MARVKLTLPDHFPFLTEINIGIGLINYGGHLGNDSALTLVHEARMRFLHSLGFTELDISGRGTILTDAVVVFKAEAFWGDVLDVSVAVDDISAYGCDFYYRFTRKSDGRDILHAKTGIVFFDYEARKPVTVPPEFLAALGMETPAK